MRIVAAVLLWGFLSAVVHAQSLTPMRGEIRSFSDRFAVRVFVGNPYQRPMQFEIGVYDKDFYPAVASITPSHVTIAGGNTLPVLVVVPFDGEREKRIRVCVEGVAYKGNSTRIRTQVCGKYLARNYAQ